jgi:hypothetical protein
MQVFCLAIGDLGYHGSILLNLFALCDFDESTHRSEGTRIISEQTPVMLEKGHPDFLVGIKNHYPGLHQISIPSFKNVG